MTDQRQRTSGVRAATCNNGRTDDNRTGEIAVWCRVWTEGVLPDVFTVAGRWCLRYGHSYRHVEELLAEREVDQVTVCRWVQLFAEAARPLRRAAGDRWFVDETYIRCRTARASPWNGAWKGGGQVQHHADRAVQRRKDHPRALPNLILLVGRVAVPLTW